MEIWEYVAKRKLKERGYSFSRLAKEVGVQKSYFSLIYNYKRVPSRKTALKIQEVTGGAVDAWELMQLCHEKSNQ